MIQIDRITLQTGRVALLRGESGFQRRAETATRKRRPDEPAPGPATTPLTDADTASRLKQLRLRLAKERGVPAFAVFPDRSPTGMARTGAGA